MSFGSSLLGDLRRRECVGSSLGGRSLMPHFMSSWRLCGDIDVGDNSCLYSMEFNKYTEDEMLVCTAQGDIHIICPFSGRMLGSLRGAHNQPVTCISYIPEEGGRSSRLFVSASLDRDIKLWRGNSHSYVNVERLTQHADWIRSLCVSESGSTMCSGCVSSNICHWDLSTCQVIGVYNEERRVTPIPSQVSQEASSGNVVLNPVTAISFHPLDESTFVMGNRNGMVRLWDTRSQSSAPVWEFKPHGGTKISTCKWLHSGRSLLTAGRDSAVRVWDMRMIHQQTQSESTGPSVRYVLEGPFRTQVPPIPSNVFRTKSVPGPVEPLREIQEALFKRGKQGVEQDGVYPVGCVHELKGHIMELYNCSCDVVDDRWVLSGSEDGKLYVWDLQRSQEQVCSPVSALPVCTDVPVGDTNRVVHMAKYMFGRMYVGLNFKSCIRMYEPTLEDADSISTGLERSSPERNVSPSVVRDLGQYQDQLLSWMHRAGYSFSMNLGTFLSQLHDDNQFELAEEVTQTLQQLTLVQSTYARAVREVAGQQQQETAGSGHAEATVGRSVSFNESIVSDLSESSSEDALSEVSLSSDEDE